MRIFVIFDHAIDIAKLKGELALLRPKEISLLPLTSEWSIIRKVKEASRSIDDAKIELLESAKLIDEEVDLLRQRISKWSANLSEHKIFQKSIKEWFLLRGNEVSTWWFSLLSEKNPQKTGVFFNCAQLGAVDKIITARNFDLCIFSVYSRSLSNTVEALCRRHSVDAARLPSLKRKKGFKEVLKLHLEKSPIFYSVLKAMHYLCVAVGRSAMAKYVMGPIRNRLRSYEESVLFVSYFPSVEKTLAEEGKLRNKYAIPLQEKLPQMKKAIVWIWIYAFLDGYSFHDALHLAAGFTKNGETNFFLDEFMSPGLLSRSVFLWLCQIRTFIRLKQIMPEHILYDSLCVPEGGKLMRDLMTESFVGRGGLENIIYFMLFKKVFSSFPQASHCIYCAEMHAWEKALNAAKGLKAPRIKSIAFQHTIVSRNYFPYFCYPTELVEDDRPTSLPMPDVIACNGDIPLNLMASCGYRNIRKVEAIRQLYLVSRLEGEVPSDKGRVLLLSGSINKDETKSLISFFLEAHPAPTDFDVWLKSHPSLPLEGILKEMGISPEDHGFIIKDEPMEELLKKARIVLVGISSVSLEALAAGCTVVLPVFADYMFLSPLDGFDKFGIKVYSPDELKQVIHENMEGESQKRDMREVVDFISNYWCLDKSLRRWEEVLA